MKNRLLAVFSACLLVSAQAVSASADWNDYGYTDYDYTEYDYNDYGTADNGYSDNGNWDYNSITIDQNTDDDTGYYTGTESADSSSQDDDVPLVDPFKDAPVTVKLLPTKIVDKKFSAELFIDANTDITAADLTISYDSKVLKLNKSTISKEVKGTLAAAETAPGTIQLQYTSDGSSQSNNDSSEESTDSDSSSKAEEKKPSYLTLDFEITDVTERSTVLYITVNSLRDLSSTEVTYRADGTIIQIEGAVPVDASADESMYSELRVARSDSLIAYDSIGLTNVKQVTVSDTNVATADEKGLKTLADGLTNMTVEFTDGTVKYYRLVVSETAPVITTQAADGNAQPVISNGQVVSDPAAADNGAGGITKTETKSSAKVKYFIIYIVALLGIIAIFAEFFFFFGNPYKKAFAVMRKRKSEREAMQEALYGEENGFFPEEQPEENSEEYYDETQPEEYEGEPQEYSDSEYPEDEDNYDEQYEDEQPEEYGEEEYTDENSDETEEKDAPETDE
ncbi:hypothetical protein SAMN02910447_02478 [Ruminococcus sp. YE71]|uniref:hypothetical protein n=1 Tax=unclassified Ruminococcus TaxID=2608920 RepID=UPI0008838658|nr:MULTISPECIES: hypothetical protein [unclassified Ruminococcus]SDA24263.1 hypothetical protein SAMN02910446_02345 [Ruminococcus sp. YE78]SFW41719.1 hypothetical protein SAMN02910447_02478 [Ruminococcus sp. YE71]